MHLEGCLTLFEMVDRKGEVRSRMNMHSATPASYDWEAAARSTASHLQQAALLLVKQQQVVHMMGFKGSKICQVGALLFMLQLMDVLGMQMKRPSRSTCTGPTAAITWKLVRAGIRVVKSHTSMFVAAAGES